MFGKKIQIGTSSRQNLITGQNKYISYIWRIFWRAWRNVWQENENRRKRQIIQLHSPMTYKQLTSIKIIKKTFNSLIWRVFW
jgi:hypothetical protein